jgi:hypothetical protein
MPYRKRAAAAAQLVLFLLPAPALPAEKDDALSRSFYVPVTIVVCEHLRGSVLYRGDEALRRLPGTQVFQFTFYPSRGQVLPELETVRVEGTTGDEAFRTEIVVSPASVYVGSKKIDLDLDEQLAQLRRRVDARHEPVTLKLRCGTSCARESHETSR